jgi:enoyl-CoA hydratase/carnithine racemase
MTYQFCKVEREGRLTVITLNRPDVLNAIHGPASRELAAVFDEFASDPDQWVAIVTGAGDRAFSAGNDLKEQARGGDVSMPESGFAGITARFDLNKPVIAAVNGIAMGGGFEIALACDLIIAADTAVFSLPEPKVGLAALAGGLIRLPALIGAKQALGLILTARRVSASEGKALGFVNEVAPAAELMATARRVASDIMSCSPMALRAAKEVVRNAAEEPSVQQALVAQWRYPAVVAMFRSADSKEGPRAFSEKRQPVWSGN